ncbi:redoxin family protein [Chromobacterium violaceum]|uniref:Probable peroxiredoxin/glutaredoxin family protein n=1 Tax=Chromobacterium violaceum (strain ATCC 12472 / DSM 30191 / JCM 1249 / CCUG 213 / NBRC 12614 / NCIMB 9131 / NCTC 9757 / MK) TaxID=243365 RepID=Q7NWF4_CHRVO|nr:redoxin family protein [Chromobacterium violaceum]AAQ59708.1 probable peroxiredoxin/glutaredoxin family protein [Chromobacterium violaceum ATCC 12472]KMN49117.1 glutathione peroxidase [Chromobacterium violaceum]KMN84791.1 glutathione peroxidase [Chromobacterium violaceum]KMN88276.1 glutathione peroxidase [Chromobacterium violaceum]KMO02188.1 glutathione peroxidase [Chromobacterium violaceum]
MLQNREGQRVPNVTFRIRENNEWKNVTTAELFDGKTVALFSLPGAFTPTCSSTHLPRFNELAPAFFANGVDAILCVSVNDTFVMNEWAKDQEAQNIVMIPDGNGDFTEGMGMLVDKQDLGFGKRSWRYSMLVKDGVVDKMFVEPQEPGDPFKVSDADTLLNYINPSAKKPDQVVVFTKVGCPHCARAKAVLAENGYDFVEVPLDNKIRGKVLGAVSGAMTAPQVFINGELIGSADEVEKRFAK